MYSDENVNGLFNIMKFILPIFDFTIGIYLFCKIFQSNVVRFWNYNSIIRDWVDY